jgi:hypothetical protein
MSALEESYSDPLIPLRAQLLRYMVLGEPFDTEGHRVFFADLAALTTVQTTQETLAAIAAETTAAWQTTFNLEDPLIEVAVAAQLTYLALSQNVPLETTPLWRQLMMNPTVNGQMTQYAVDLSHAVDGRTRIGWGGPNDWFSYDPENKRITISLVKHLTFGAARARAVVRHEVTHADISLSWPDGLKAIRDEMEEIKGRILAANQEGRDASEKDYRRLVRLKAAFAYRHTFYNAAEDNAVNRQTEFVGSSSYFDLGRSLNEVEAIMALAGIAAGDKSALLTPDTTQTEQEELPALLPEQAALAHAYDAYHTLIGAVNMAFFANNGLFIPLPEGWESVNIDISRLPLGATPETFPDAMERFIRAIDGPDGLSYMQPKLAPFLLRLLPAYSKEALAKKRNKAIDALWDRYAAPLVKPLLDAIENQPFELPAGTESRTGPSTGASAPQNQSNAGVPNPTSPPQTQASSQNGAQQPKTAGQTGQATPPVPSTPNQSSQGAPQKPSDAPSQEGQGKNGQVEPTPDNAPSNQATQEGSQKEGNEQQQPGQGKQQPTAPTPQNAPPSDQQTSDSSQKPSDGRQQDSASKTGANDPTSTPSMPQNAPENDQRQETSSKPEAMPSSRGDKSQNQAGEQKTPSPGMDYPKNDSSEDESKSQANAQNNSTKAQPQRDAAEAKKAADKKNKDGKESPQGQGGGDSAGADSSGKGNGDGASSPGGKEKSQSGQGGAGQGKKASKEGSSDTPSQAPSSTPPEGGASRDGAPQRGTPQGGEKTLGSTGQEGAPSSQSPSSSSGKGANASPSVPPKGQQGGGAGSSTGTPSGQQGASGNPPPLPIPQGLPGQTAGATQSLPVPPGLPQGNTVNGRRAEQASASDGDTASIENIGPRTLPRIPGKTPRDDAKNARGATGDNDTSDKENDKKAGDLKEKLKEALDQTLRKRGSDFGEGSSQQSGSQGEGPSHRGEDWGKTLKELIDAANSDGDKIREALREQSQVLAENLRATGQHLGPSIDNLPDGDWSDYQARMIVLGPYVTLIEDKLRALKAAQRERRELPSLENDLLPEDGDFSRFDFGAEADRVIKKASGQLLEEADYRVFNGERIQETESTPIIVLKIDGSGSMKSLASNGRRRIDMALDAGVAIREACNNLEIPCFLMVWGPSNPQVLAKPGDDPYEVGVNIEKFRNGMNSSTYLAPALYKFVETLAETSSRVPYSGHVHMMIFSDGDIDDDEVCKKVLSALFEECPEMTIDVGLVVDKDNNTMCDMMKGLQIEAPVGSIGIHKEFSAGALATTLVETLTTRMDASNSLDAQPEEDVMCRYRLARERLADLKI